MSLFNKYIQFMPENHKKLIMLLFELFEKKRKIVIPKVIKYLCLTFYFEFDYFYLYDEKRLTVSFDKRELSTLYPWWSTAYNKLDIKGIATYEWILKIKFKSKYLTNIYIGLDSILSLNNNPLTLRHHMFINDRIGSTSKLYYIAGNGYAFSCEYEYGYDGNNFTRYTTKLEPFCNGDHIKMIVNMQKKELSFKKVNGEKIIKIQFDPSFIYRMGVTLYNYYDAEPSVKIIDFKTVYASNTDSCNFLN